MNIDIIYDSVNFSIIKDRVTHYIWLYSDRKPIAYFDTDRNKIIRYDKTSRQTTHIGVFKKRLKDLFN